MNMEGVDMNMKKITGIGLAVLCCSLSVSAAVINSAQTGSWADTATWSGGVVPGSADTAVVKAHTVTSGANEGSLAGLNVDGAGAVLNMNSGSSISVLGTAGNVRILNGSMNIATNASFTHDAASDRYISLALADSADGTLNINGGSVTTKSTLIIGSTLSTGGATASVTVNSGSLSVTGPRIQFGGAAGASMSLNLNGGTVSAIQVRFQDNGLGTKRLNVNGGALYLKNSNASTSLVFTDTSAKLMFEAGTVIFEGVNDAAAFTAFQTTFNSWVDAGNVDSVSLTDQNLKDGLIFNGTDAVLTVIPEPVTLGLFIVAGSALMVLRRVM